MREQRGPDQDRDRFDSPHYTKFVEELAGVLDLDAGLAVAMMKARYAALSVHLAEVLDLDAGLHAALSAAEDDEGTLFAASALAGSAGVTDQVMGYGGPATCQIAGITYRQLDYWARTGLVVPSICDASGSSSQRLYSLEDVVVLKVVKRLLDTGVSLDNIRPAVKHLRRRGVSDLARLTLFSDGTTVYECTSPEEVVDLLRGGQSVFGIAVGGAMKEIAESIYQFFPERADGGQVTITQEDELTKRRRARRVS
jgi:DNA-binding transcriptional MerR regulator